MPVDIAGFTDHQKVIKVFMENVARKIDAEVAIGPGVAEDAELVTPADNTDKPVVEEAKNQIVPELPEYDATAKVKVPVFNEMDQLN